MSSSRSSDAGIRVDLGFRRCELAVQRRVANSQIEASEHQLAAADAQKSAAKWTRVSAIAVAASVVVTVIGIWLNFFFSD